MPPYEFKPKTENKNTLYITPCLNVTSCIEIKNRKQIRNRRLYDRNRKKCKSSLQAQKKSTINIKILCFFAREFIVSVSFPIPTTLRLRSFTILFASIA